MEGRDQGKEGWNQGQGWGNTTLPSAAGQDGAHIFLFSLVSASLLPFVVGWLLVRPPLLLSGALVAFLDLVAVSPFLRRCTVG